MDKRLGHSWSDISGAVDRVPKERLAAKLREAGVGSKMTALVIDYLAPRCAGVAVGGALSELVALSNMVFQGTVFGPPLWNIFFADVADAVQASHANEAVSADDLNAFRAFDAKTTNEQVKLDMADCQQVVHLWGTTNGVALDPMKESFFMVLHHVSGEGPVFKLLGAVFDAKLVMEAAVTAIVRKAGPKLTALLRTKPYYSTGDMMQAYKSHVLCLLEGATGAVYHASATVLARLDHLQERFLRELNLIEEDAFLNFNLAPLSLRREIAMLGLIFKCAKGEKLTRSCARCFREALSRNTGLPRELLRHATAASYMTKATTLV